MENIKINKLEIENVKRIKAVKMEPTKNGLTIIGGRNNQGKTSVLDSIAWALGGDRYCPSMAVREGSSVPPNLHVVLSNGLVVERRGKNSDLKVTDPEGHKGGQQLLNDFVEQLALDLPKFMSMTIREKSDTLLRIIGVGDMLAELEKQEKDLYNERLYIGRTADQKEKFAKEMPYFPDAPSDIISISELIQQQQDILARNGENQRKRYQVKNLEYIVQGLEEKVDRLTEQLKEAKQELHKAVAELETARKSAQNLQDESTEELEKNIEQIEYLNQQVRANLDKAKAEEEAGVYKSQYADMTVRLTEVREKKTALLDSAELPLEGLSIVEKELIYKGQKWDNMSASDQLKVSTAIVRKINPKCGFVLLDKLEQMDLETLNEFGRWLEQEGLQAIATRVSTGDECSIIIEDGYAIEEKKTEYKPVWTKGEF